MRDSRGEVRKTVEGKVIENLTGHRREMGVIAEFGAEGHDLTLFSEVFIFGCTGSLLCSCMDQMLLFAVGHRLHSCSTWARKLQLRRSRAWAQ